MQVKTIYYTLALLSFVAWLAEGIVLLNISDQSVRQVSSVLQDIAEKNASTLSNLKNEGLVEIDIEKVESNVYRRITTLKWLGVAVMVIGILSSITVVISRYLWLIGSTLASISYFLLWHIMGFTSRVNLWEAYKLKWMLAEAMGQTGVFVLQNVVLPIICLAVIATASLEIKRRYSLKRKN